MGGTAGGPVLARGVDVVVDHGRVTAIVASGEGGGPGHDVWELPGRLVLPGLVNLHAHCTGNAHHLLVDGAGEPELLGATYLTTKAPRSPLPPGLDPRVAARWAVWELLRGGTTTVLDAGGSPAQAAALAAEATAVGLRAHVGVSLSSGRWAAAADGALDWVDRSEDDDAQLAAAEALLDALDPEGTVRGAVVVAQADTASDRLLREAHALARRRQVPFTLHAAQNRREVLLTLARFGTTPLTRLHRLGVLGPGTILAHAVHLDHHPAVATGTVELGLLAASGAAVAHCPRHLAQRGEALRSLSAYRTAGVPVGLGTDTMPRDLVAEVGTALLVDRVVSGGTATVAGVVDAATRVGADALGRAELGRIQVGGPADLVVVDLREVGLLADPVRAAVEHAGRHEVEHVLVGGAHLVREGEVVGIDPAPLRAAAQRAADALGDSAPSWHRHGRAAAELAPPPYPHAPAEAVARTLEVIT
ncbi:MAG: amidohydrolase family protein [Acidimicrobiia bacterium]